MEFHGIKMLGEFILETAATLTSIDSFEETQVGTLGYLPSGNEDAFVEGTIYYCTSSGWTDEYNAEWAGRLVYVEYHKTLYLGQSDGWLNIGLIGARTASELIFVPTSTLTDEDVQSVIETLDDIKLNKTDLNDEILASDAYNTLLKKSNNLSDLEDVGEALENLELGTAEQARQSLGFGTGVLYNVGIFAGNIVQLNQYGQLPALDGSLLFNLNISQDSTCVSISDDEEDGIRVLSSQEIRRHQIYDSLVDQNSGDNERLLVLSVVDNSTFSSATIDAFNDNLICAYTLSESTGNRYNLRNPGSLVEEGAVLSTLGYDGVDAASFDGGSFLYDNHDRFLTHDELSVHFLILPDQPAASTGCIISKGGSDFDFEIGYTPGTVYATVQEDGLGGALKTVSGACSNNNLHQVIVTLDGVNIRLYVDGSLLDTTAYNGTIRDSSIPKKITVGSRDGQDSYSGTLQHLYIWNTGISAGAVTALYNAGTYRLYSHSLVKRYTLSSKTESDILSESDISLNNLGEKSFNSLDDVPSFGSAALLDIDTPGGVPSIDSTTGEINPSFIPQISHAVTHKSGQDDEIKLDELGTPTDNSNLNASTLAHGLLPKLPNNTSYLLSGLGTWRVFKLDEFGDADDTTNLDSSELRHGLLPKLSGNSSEFLNGLGQWEIPLFVQHGYEHELGGADAIKLDAFDTPDDTTNLDATDSYHGLLPKLPGDNQYFLNGIGQWVNPAFPSVLHASQHLLGGMDEILLDELGIPSDTTNLDATDTYHGLLPKLPGDATYYLNGVGQWTSFFHAISHGEGGVDALKLDALAIPDDTTNLDATDTYHGLLPKLPGDGSYILNGAGQWVLFAHALEHGEGGSDALKLDALAIPDDTTNLDATDTYHGLLPKLIGDNAYYLDGTGNWSLFAHADKHYLGGPDSIPLDALDFPGDNVILNATPYAHGLCPKLSGQPHKFLNGLGNWEEPPGEGAWDHMIEDSTEELVESDNRKAIYAVWKNRREFGNDIIDAYSNFLDLSWSLGEESGNREDVINGYNLVPVNGSVPSTVGLIGNAASFGDANLAYLAAPDVEVLNGVDSFSISCIARQQDHEVRGTVFRYGSDVESDPIHNCGILIRFLGGYLQFNLYQSDFTRVITEAFLNDFNVHHIVATADGTNIRLYVDGVLRDTKAYDGTINHLYRSIYVGGFNSIQYYDFHGWIQHLNVWGGIAVSQSAVTELYNNGAGTRYSTEEEAAFKMSNYKIPTKVASKISSVVSVSDDSTATLYENDIGVSTEINTIRFMNTGESVDSSAIVNVYYIPEDSTSVEAEDDDIIYTVVLGSSEEKEISFSSGTGIILKGRNSFIKVSNAASCDTVNITAFGYNQTSKEILNSGQFLTNTPVSIYSNATTKKMSCQTILVYNGESGSQKITIYYGETAETATIFSRFTLSEKETKEIKLIEPGFVFESGSDDELFAVCEVPDSKIKIVVFGKEE